jgi:hypothetical protein
MLLEKMKTISDTFTVVTDISLKANVLYLALQCSAMHMFPKSFICYCAFALMLIDCRSKSLVTRLATIQMLQYTELEIEVLGARTGHIQKT